MVKSAIYMRTTSVVPNAPLTHLARNDRAFHGHGGNPRDHQSGQPLRGSRYILIGACLRSQQGIFDRLHPIWGSGSKIAHLQNDNPAKVNVGKINEYKYIYNISSANGTFIIYLPVTYSPYWDCSIIAGKNNVSSVSHIETDGFQNSYVIDAHGDFSIEIFFVPQNNLNIFAYMSVSCIIIEHLYIVLFTLSRKRDQEKRFYMSGMSITPRS